MIWQAGRKEPPAAGGPRAPDAAVVVPQAVVPDAAPPDASVVGPVPDAAVAAPPDAAPRKPRPKRNKPSVQRGELIDE